MPYIKKLKPHEFKIWHGKKPLLVHLDIEMTERCNNNCIHCCINLPEDDDGARTREMDTAFVKDILTQAADLGCLTVRFTGGEPLLRGDLAELYEFARRLGMRVILFTNARLITPELAALLARMPPGRVVEVTVYGMRPESYDRTVGKKGAFAEFRRGVSLLEEYKIPFIVKAPLLHFLKDEMAEFETWAQTIPSMDNRPPGYSMNFDLRNRRDDPAKNARIKTLRATPEKTLDMVVRDPLYLKGMKEFCGKFMRSPGDKLFSCGAGHGTCIDAYGKAQMCMGMRDPGMVYDLRDGTDHHYVQGKAIPGAQADIASSQKSFPAMTGLQYALTEFFPKFMGLRPTNPDYINRCARCFLKGLCEQCPAKSWTENGTLDTPVEYLCDVAHAQARRLELIAPGENAWEVEDGMERVKQFSS